ncbi:hypothetical protein NP233_g2502 [Leucocoprinus birnbaumii]|uniref:Cytochrome P450 n=1 Tax=Leucocoprinus birnbaumii TaxID=56174 RepID=A0AAD5VY48_9AGAR|nr:hypothetical protein NP233_g2502 [Leucocoprinus birnbaumii]
MPGALVAISTPLLAVVVYYALKFTYDESTSPFRNFAGPPSSNPLLGNFFQLFDAGQLDLHRKWIQEYGSTFKYKGLLSRSRLFTSDLKAINHILMNSYTYQKPEAATYSLRRSLGEGVLLAEGDAHKNQRRVLNPAFGPLQIRELTVTFFEKAIQLRDAWAAKLQTGDGTARVDALSWLSKATLDIIGEAGFGYDFGSLTEDPNHRSELGEAFEIMFKVGTRPSLLALLRGLIPILRVLPADRDAETKKAKQIMMRIGKELLQERKSDSTAAKMGSGSKDLLSLLVRANTSPGLPSSQRMSDEEVVAQIPTFIVAGHETTSTATSWALYALTKHKDVQAKLREELRQVSTDNPTMDELNSLSYLDAVVREALRLYAPVTSTLRVTTKDDVIPLDEPVVDRTGKTHDHLEIKKGQTVMIPITLINSSTKIWGEDAKDFNPSRWTSTPSSAGSIPGIWGNLMTFLGGQRACIGYRFSLVEMKALLFTLLRAFEFELAVPHDDIVPKSEVVTRPVLRTDPNNANQLPVIIRAVSVDVLTWFNAPDDGEHEGPALTGSNAKLTQ